MSKFEFWDIVTTITQADVHRLEAMWKITYNEAIGQALDKAYDMHEAMMDIFNKVWLEEL